MSRIQTNSYLADDIHALTIDRLMAAPANPGMCLRSTIFEILADAGVLPLRYLTDLVDERRRRREREEKKKDEGEE